MAKICLILATALCGRIFPYIYVYTPGKNRFIHLNITYETNLTQINSPA